MFIHLFHLLVEVGFFDNLSSALSLTSPLYLHQPFAVQYISTLRIGLLFLFATPRTYQYCAIFTFKSAPFYKHPDKRALQNVPRPLNSSSNNFVVAVGGM